MIQETHGLLRDSGESPKNFYIIWVVTIEAGDWGGNNDSVSEKKPAICTDSISSLYCGLNAKWNSIRSVSGGEFQPGSSSERDDDCTSAGSCSGGKLLGSRTRIYTVISNGWPCE